MKPIVDVPPGAKSNVAPAVRATRDAKVRVLPVVVPPMTTWPWPAVVVSAPSASWLPPVKPSNCKIPPADCVPKWPDAEVTPSALKITAPVALKISVAPLAVALRVSFPLLTVRAPVAVLAAESVQFPAPVLVTEVETRVTLSRMIPEISLA